MRQAIWERVLVGQDWVTQMCLALRLDARHYALMPALDVNLLRQAIREWVLVGQHRGGTPRGLPNGRIPVSLGVKKAGKESVQKAVQQ